MNKQIPRLHKIDRLTVHEAIPFLWLGSAGRWIQLLVDDAGRALSQGACDLLASGQVHRTLPKLGMTHWIHWIPEIYGAERGKLKGHLRFPRKVGVGHEVSDGWYIADRGCRIETFH